MGKKFGIRTHEKSKSSIGRSMVEASKQEIKILPEIEYYIRKLKPSELAQLEKSLNEHGCKDPLKIWPWKGENILIDGHHRYMLCQKNGIDFDVTPVHFNTLEEAKEYMISTQLGRRNLNKYEMAYYRGCYYNLHKKTTGDERSGDGTLLSDELGEEHGVTGRTIRTDSKVATVLDSMLADSRKNYLAGESMYTRALLEKTHKELENIESVEKYLDLLLKGGKPVVVKVQATKVQSYRKKIDKMVGEWNKQLDVQEKNEVINYLEERLKELKES